MSQSPLGKAVSVGAVHQQSQQSLLPIAAAASCNVGLGLLGANPHHQPPSASTGFSVTDILSPLDEYAQQKKSVQAMMGSTLDNFSPYRSSVAQTMCAQSAAVATGANPYLSAHCPTAFPSHNYQTADFSTYAAAAAATNPSAGWYGASPDPRFGSESVQSFRSCNLAYLISASSQRKTGSLGAGGLGVSGRNWQFRL